jgi:hypothetical protein
VRIAIQHRGRQADRREQLLHVLALLVVVHRAAVVRVEGLTDLVPDAVDGVPGVHRALEDHRDLLPAALAHLLAGQLEEVLAIEPDLTGDVLRVGRQQAQQREGVLDR